MLQKTSFRLVQRTTHRVHNPDSMYKSILYNVRAGGTQIGIRLSVQRLSRWATPHAQSEDGGLGLITVLSATASTGPRPP